MPEKISPFLPKELTVLTGPWGKNLCGNLAQQLARSDFKSEILLNLFSISHKTVTDQLPFTCDKTRKQVLQAALRGTLKKTKTKWGNRIHVDPAVEVVSAKLGDILSRVKHSSIVASHGVFMCG